MTVPEVVDYTQVCFPFIPMLIVIALIWFHAKLLEPIRDPTEYEEDFQLYVATIRLYSELAIIRDFVHQPLRFRPADAA